MVNRYHHCQSGRLPQDLSDDVDGDYIRRNLNNLKSMFRKKTMTPESKLKRKSLKRKYARKKARNSLKLRAKGKRGSCRSKGYTSAVVKSSRSTSVAKNEKTSTKEAKTLKIQKSKMSNAPLKLKSQCRSRSSGAGVKRKISHRNERSERKM